MNDNQQEPGAQWYVIRVTYSREMQVKSRLDAMAIESWVPMHLVERALGGTVRKVFRPLIHNLIFVHTRPEVLLQLKRDTTLPIRYLMDRASGQPTVVPQQQMHDFMAVVATRHKNIEIVGPRQADLAHGDRVRVIDGPFVGIEGAYIRHKGHSKVAVEIAGVATALTAYVPLKYITKLT